MEKKYEQNEIAVAARSCPDVELSHFSCFLCYRECPEL
jgi:hypothetical protein